MNTDKTGEKILETTDIRTLWSETLLELLQEAIVNHWSNHALKEIVSELQRKGYSQKRLMKMVKKRFGADSARQFGVRAGFITATVQQGSGIKPGNNG